MAKKKSCFVISPIGPTQSEERYRADLVMDYLIKPAAKPLGYDPQRADEDTNPGFITTQIVNRIIDADLVIADLSGKNANVFYELAVRHVARKPFVQLIRNDEELPFDVKAMRTVLYALEDPRQLEAKVEELAQFIKAAVETEPEDVETPISFALELKARRESGEPTEQALAELQEDMAALRSDVRSMMSAYKRAPLIATSGFVGRSVFGDSVFPKTITVDTARPFNVLDTSRSFNVLRRPLGEEEEPEAS